MIRQNNQFILTKINNGIDKRKYEILLISLLLIMFGMRPTYIYLFLLVQIMVVGAMIFHHRRFLLSLIIGLILFTLALSIYSKIYYFKIVDTQTGEMNLHSLIAIAFIVYFVLIALEVFRRILIVQQVSSEIISAVLCGFIMLSFIGWFLFDIIETYTPGSFSGLGEDGRKFNNLLYFSVTNLLTLGFGDILPVTLLARKAVMFMGFTGHVYTVFVTGIIIGKYINQSNIKFNDQ